MRSISVLDFLCLDYLVKRYPPAAPALRQRSRPVDPRALRARRTAPLAAAPTSRRTEALGEGDSRAASLPCSSCVAIRPWIGEPPTGQGLDVDLDPDAWSSSSARSIKPHPHRAPGRSCGPSARPNKKPTFAAGPALRPQPSGRGAFACCCASLLNFRNAQLRSGVPFDVRAFLEDASGPDRRPRRPTASATRCSAASSASGTWCSAPRRRRPGRIREPRCIRSPRVRKFRSTRPCATSTTRPCATGGAATSTRTCVKPRRPSWTRT